MKVYFTASITGKKHYFEQYKRIIDTLISGRNKVVSDHILSASESKISLETREERLKFHGRLEKWIASADCVIVEATFPSISVGYEISLALHLRKPVLILYYEGEPPNLLAEHKDEKVICEKYTMDNVCDIIEDFMMYIEGAVDTRFTFYITPQIAAYLEKITKKAHMPKAVYLRQLIEGDMRKHS